MLSNIILLRHTNYSNRTIKRHETVSGYIRDDYSYLQYNNINFYPGDGITAEIPLNDSTLTSGPTVGYMPLTDANYLLTVEGSTITGRWFIMETRQNRAGQYLLSLRRDVIADNMDAVLDADMFIDKATVPSVYDVAIYNKEASEFNSIKERETLLSDGICDGWVVGYYANNTSAQMVNVDFGYAPIIRVSTLESWDYYDISDRKYTDINLKLEIKTQTYNSAIKRLNRITLSRSISDGYRIDNNDIGLAVHAPLRYQKSSRIEAGVTDEQVFQSVLGLKEDIFNIFYSTTDYYREDDTIESYNSQYIYVTVGTEAYPAGLYRVSVVRAHHYTHDDYSYAASSPVSQQINAYIAANAKAIWSPSGILSEVFNHYDADATDKSITLLDIKYDTYTMAFTKVSEGPSTFTIPATSNTLKDAPYKMFAIPCGPVKADITGKASSYTNDVTYQTAMTVASAIATTMGDALYDLQVLPYCPCRTWIYGDSLHVPNDTASRVLIPMNADDTRGIPLLFPEHSSFTINIDQDIMLPDDVIERKVVGQCDTYRLVSPNYSAVFEFNPVKTGSISKFNVDCTYKPFSPYIHINPIWGGLYGGDFDDTRGLVVQGDFSMPVVSSKWTDYMVNNKNYLNAFNREIDSIELHNRWALAMESVGAVGATVGGAVKGAAKGGVAGAIVGGVAGAAGGGLGIARGESLRRDALDLKRDLFNYSLQNIQAVPTTLAKVSSVDFNTRLVPMIEYYTCTYQEKESFRESMRLKGMTIGRKGTLRQFMNGKEQYVQGTVIRMDIPGDSHMLDEITMELSEGVYLYE